MKTKDQKKPKSRRQFLHTMAVGGVASLGAEAVTQEEAVPEAEATQSGYQETEHVKAYYRASRF